MNIQAPYIANLFEYASYAGVSEELLRRHLREEQLDVCDQLNVVSESEYVRIFEALMKATADGNFGIHYGCYLNLKALGFIVEISLNASSIEQAVLILQSYLHTTFPVVRLEAERKDGKFLLRLLSSLEDEVLKFQVLDFVSCIVYRELKLMLPNAVLPKFEIPHSNTLEFSKFLNGDIGTGSDYLFVFDAAVLTTEINRKKAKEIETLLPKYLQMLEMKKSEYKAFSIQVRNMILNMCCPELPTFEQVAIHFPHSFRTIQRKLTDEGLSFRKISDDIKNELSGYLSKGHKMKTQDIAYLLGYSESSAYLHAVKKWKTEFINSGNRMEA